MLSVAFIHQVTFSGIIENDDNRTILCNVDIICRHASLPSKTSVAIRCLPDVKTYIPDFHESLMLPTKGVGIKISCQVRSFKMDLDTGESRKLTKPDPFYFLAQTKVIFLFCLCRGVPFVFEGGQKQCVSCFPVANIFA